MTEIVSKSRINRLRELHGLVVSSAVKTFEAAIEAGKILTEIKRDLPHGSFISWCKDNLPFNIRTAQRYMRCYTLRDRLLKNDTMSLLEAYRLLKKPKGKAELLTWPLMLKKMKEWLNEEREYLSLLEQAQKTDEPWRYMVALAEANNNNLNEKLSDQWENLKKLVEGAQIDDFKYLLEAIDIFRKLQNTCFIINLYWHREIGKILNDLEVNWPEMYKAYISGNKKEQQRLRVEIEKKIAEERGQKGR